MVLKKGVISVSIDAALIQKMARSTSGASKLVAKALNQFFHLEDENIDVFSNEELTDEYEKSKLRSAAIDMELSDRKRKTDAEVAAKITELKRESEEQRTRIENRHKELAARGGGGMRA